MARSVVISKKTNGSDPKGKNNIKMRGSSNLMTSSMPPSVLTKTLYSNGSAASQRNNNSADVMNKSIPNRRNQISKSQQNKSEAKIKDSKPTRNGQVRISYQNGMINRSYILIKYGLSMWTKNNNEYLSNLEYIE